MTDDGWTAHLVDRTERLPYEYFRELVLDVWRLRGFEVAKRYEGGGAEFVAVRRSEDSVETEVVAVSETVTADGVRALADVEVPEAVRVAVGERFADGAEDEARRLGVETVGPSRIAALVQEGGYHATFYRWVALSAAEEPDVVARDDAPLRRGEGQGVVLGRSTAERLGAGDGDVVRVAGEAAGVVERGGVLERGREYVSIGEGYPDAVDAEEGERVTVELLGTGEARRVYVVSEPSMDAELAAEVWRGYAPYPGMELRQPYGDGELWTMALESLPDDYSYVSDETDVVVEGYAGARRVFE